MFCSMDVIIEEIEDDQELYIERDLRMPPLGSRVKRGRDWQWGDQDMFGPGTVVGHSKDGKRSVNSIIGTLYSYNNPMSYKFCALFEFLTVP